MSQRTLSPSQLKVFLSCEEKWRLQYVEKLSPKGSNPLFFEKGSYTHELIHYMYKLVSSGYPVGSQVIIDAVVDRIKEDMAKEIAAAIEQDREPDIQFFRNISKAIVPYLKNVSLKIDSESDDFRQELHLEVPTEHTLFHGFVDLIYWDKVKKKRVIRDHKTGSSNTWTTELVEKDVQLLMYGTLWYKLTGEVADVEINYLNTSQASKPRPGTVLFGLFEAQHTESTYVKFWDYLLSVAERMNNLQTLQNFAACGKCPYYRICRAGLRGYSADQIKKANFYGPTAKDRQEVRAKDSVISEKTLPSFHVNIGGRNH